MYMQTSISNNQSRSQRAPYSFMDFIRSDIAPMESPVEFPLRHNIQCRNSFRWQSVKYVNGNGTSEVFRGEDGELRTWGSGNQLQARAYLAEILTTATYPA